ncbi:class I SAM-dependent methyltransferase [Bacillus sp. RG28]|uniref:Class I SAM-dependent methyltransferase n=1 Tax=Gottfriedia endophytica TaxID=2820819 RepID=A0A940SL08_9BACI|nr:class I SAM-dependent methyltransferase [Gottfriedia endophytica]MBP0725823.1 class I SAM-dependent methyltransferase [Gottfriedia endophytica]
MKGKSIHIRINETILEKFEEALIYEGINKTEFLTHAIQNFCSKVESEKMNDIKRQYGTSTHLQVRIDTHVKYEEKRIDLDEMVINLLNLTNDEKILDIGCATGAFLTLLQTIGHKGQLTGLDQSPKMIEEANKKSQQKNLNIEWIIGDARKLPFSSNSYDWVVARHMLYHVPDIQKTIEGFKRIIKPNGGLVTTTNSRNSLPRIMELCNNMLVEFGFPERISSAAPFCIENAKEILSSTFDSVEEKVISNSLVFEQAEPIVNYITSMFPSLNIPDNTDLYTDMKNWLKIEAENILLRNGKVWRDPKDVGFYLCKK